VQATIVECIGEGLYMVHAAALAGVTDRAARGWLARGETGEEPYASFLSAVKVAEATSLRRAMAAVRGAKSGPDSHPWQASAWFMERRYREGYGRSFVQADKDTGEVIDPTTPEGRAKAVADLKRLPADMLREALGEES